MPLTKLQVDPLLSDRAYRAIREAILSLELKPGDYVSIQELTDQLGVSRTPIRDALLRLGQEGLVSVVPYKGAYVSNVSIEDIKEIMELRIVLEGYAARRAAESLSEDELAQAEMILNRAESALAEGRYADSAIIGQEFHKLQFDKVGNSRFLDFMRQIDTHYGRIRLLAARQPGRLEKSFEEDRRTLAALRARDPEAAERAMAAHLSATRDDLLSVQVDPGITNLADVLSNANVPWAFTKDTPMHG